MNIARGVLITALAVALLATTAHAAQESSVGQQLEAIRARVRTEAGVTKPTQTCTDDLPVAGDAKSVDDLPMVQVTVLPGDSHRTMALELTGTFETIRFFKAIEPHLAPGEKIMVPRTLLRSRLSDPSVVTFTMGKSYSSLWSLVRGELSVSAKAAPRTVRNIQRFNSIANASRVFKGQKIRVPRALMSSSANTTPLLKIYDDYRVSNLNRLNRKPPAKSIPAYLSRKLKKKKVLWARQLEKPEISLVVIHTTEHGGAPFDNVARFMRKNRLAHYLVSPKGNIYRIVDEKYRAYGSGESLWDGRYAVDHDAINIEIFADTVRKRDKGISKVQYVGLKRLLDDIQTRRPNIHTGRLVTHRMVAASYKYGTRSRKGDPYRFDWAAAGLPDNSAVIDQDVLMGRVKLCRDKRYADRVTQGQSSAARMLHSM